MRDHTLTETEYLSLKQQYEEEAAELREELEELQKEEGQGTNFPLQNKWITTLKKFQESKTDGGKTALTRQMAVELIKHIRISGYNEVEIVWNFQDEFMRMDRFLCMS